VGGTASQRNNCRLSSTCTNKASFVSDLPPGNSGSLSTNTIQLNTCSISSKCTNDAKNKLGDLGQTNACFSSTCDNSGSNNFNQCYSASVCTNSGDAPFGSNNLNRCFESVCDNSGHGTGAAKSGFHNTNRCLNGALCTNSGENTNVVADGVSCSSGAPGTTTTCLPGQPPIVRP